MALTAGALSKTQVGQQVAALSSAVATGGTGPYTYQWYRSTTSGFTPGAGNIVAGATSLTLNDSGLQPGTSYYYVVVVTDTGDSNVTADSSQLPVATEPGQNQNQFAQSQIQGMVDLSVGPTNVVSGQVDQSVATAAAPYNVVSPGQAVKIVASTKGGIPKVAPCSSKSDAALGFVVYNVKDIQYVAGQNLEIALFGTVIWCYATGAITQFAEACLDVTYIGGVQASGNSATLMGWAYDGCSGAGLIRVMLLPNASFATA